MNRLTLIAAISAVAAVSLGLTGCASAPPVHPVASKSSRAFPTTPAPTPSPTQWWGNAATAPKAPLEDHVLIGNVSVDPSETPGANYAWAGDPTHPAPIASNGNINVQFIAYVGQLKRVVTAAYVSRSADGASAGPQVHCAPHPLGFLCSAQFNAATGTYYVVVDTAPADTGDAAHGALHTVAPFYTKAAGE